MKGRKAPAEEHLTLPIGLNHVLTSYKIKHLVF